MFIEFTLFFDTLWNAHEIHRDTHKIINFLLLYFSRSVPGLLPQPEVRREPGLPVFGEPAAGDDLPRVDL